MKISELIQILETLPPETKVLINAELGRYDLEEKDLQYRKIYNIWHSHYNNNHTPYVDYCGEPRDFVYKSQNPNVEDYVCKTLGDEMVILLG